MRILVVDDSSTMRRILKQSLGRCGITDIAEGANGVEALKLAQESQFDCVMTDWNMPEMDGLELTINLRKLPNYAKTPIIMVTTEGGKNDVIEALTQGVNCYIVKPFTPDTVKDKLKELFPTLTI